MAINIEIKERDEEISCVTPTRVTPHFEAWVKFYYQKSHSQISKQSIDPEVCELRKKRYAQKHAIMLGLELGIPLEDLKTMKFKFDDQAKTWEDALVQVRDIVEDNIFEFSKTLEYLRKDITNANYQEMWALMSPLLPPYKSSYGAAKGGQVILLPHLEMQLKYQMELKKFLTSNIRNPYLIDCLYAEIERHKEAGERLIGSDGSSPIPTNKGNIYSTPIENDNRMMMILSGFLSPYQKKASKISDRGDCKDFYEYTIVFNQRLVSILDDCLANIGKIRNVLKFILDGLPELKKFEESFGEKFIFFLDMKHSCEQILKPEYNDDGILETTLTSIQAQAPRTIKKKFESFEKTTNFLYPILEEQDMLQKCFVILEKVVEEIRQLKSTPKFETPFSFSESSMPSYSLTQTDESADEFRKRKLNELIDWKNRIEQLDKDKKIRQAEFAKSFLQPDTKEKKETCETKVEAELQEFEIRQLIQIHNLISKNKIFDALFDKNVTIKVHELKALAMALKKIFVVSSSFQLVTFVGSHFKVYIPNTRKEWDCVKSDNGETSYISWGRSDFSTIDACIHSKESHSDRVLGKEAIDHCIRGFEKAGITPERISRALEIGLSSKPSAP